MKGFQMTLRFKECSSFFISSAPPRVFNGFLDLQGPCTVNDPRVKSRVGIKMWAQCQMHSCRLKRNTWLPSVFVCASIQWGKRWEGSDWKERSLLLVSAHCANSDFFSSHTLLYSINLGKAPHKTSPLVSPVPFFCSPARTDLFNSLSPPASALAPHSSRLDSDNK